MDGDIVNPGDLYGRVLSADDVDLSWDGNQISALVGPDLVVGVSGFGDAVHDALRELADHLIEEAVWVEITKRKSIDPATIGRCDSGTIQTNVVQLYRIDEGRICAVAVQEDSSIGVFGIGASVHQALRHLADELVRQGVWVEVTSRTEWQFVDEIPSANRFREEPKADGRPEGVGPTPTLQVCRGISLSNENYEGCPYGSAELRPLTGTCDCPVCHGSGYEGVTATWVPHCDFGDPECAGFLYGLVRGQQGYIECNDCDAVVRTVPAADLKQALNEMEASLEVASEKCSSCGKVNLFPGFSQMEVYTCRGCGEVIRLPDGPDIDRFFGPAD